MIAVLVDHRDKAEVSKKPKGCASYGEISNGRFHLESLLCQGRKGKKKEKSDFG